MVAVGDVSAVHTRIFEWTNHRPAISNGQSMTTTSSRSKSCDGLPMIYSGALGGEGEGGLNRRDKRRQPSG